MNVDQGRILCYSIPLHQCATWKLSVPRVFSTSNCKHNSMPNELEPDLIPDNLLSCHLHLCNERSKWNTEGCYFSPTPYRDVNEFSKVKGSEDSGANSGKMSQEYKPRYSCRRKIIKEKQINRQVYRNGSTQRRERGGLQFENNHSKSSLWGRAPNEDHQPVSGTTHSLTDNTHHSCSCWGTTPETNVAHRIFHSKLIATFLRLRKKKLETYFAKDHWEC